MWDEPLRDRAEAATQLLESLPENRRVTVLADADVDGVSSAAILARALQRVGRRFRVVLSRRRDEAFFDGFLAKRPDLLITADLGASEVARFQASHVPTIILDHHTPKGDDGHTVVHVNPHLVGEDGSRTASGAAVSYTFAAAMLESAGREHADLLGPALLGARGDRYHGGATGGLHARLEARVDATPGISWRAGPVLPDAPLGVALADSLDPFVGRAAGRPAIAAKLLGEIGIDADAHVGALGDEARRALASWLALELLGQGAAPGMVESAVSPAIRFDAGPFEGADVDTLAAMVDAACRADRAGEALAALLGAADAKQMLGQELQEYRRRIREPVLQAARGRLVALGPAVLLRVEHGRYSGCVADRIMAWTRVGDRPLVVLGPTGPRLKVSLRARGGASHHLDRIAEAAATRCGGVGGGHHLAAGANVPAEKEAQFLEMVAEALGGRTDAQHPEDGP